MKTVYANDVWHGDHEVVRGLIVVPKTIDENMQILFDDKDRSIIEFAMTHEKTRQDGGFHLFKRFCQFVVYFGYDDTEVLIGDSLMKIGISIEVMYFGTSDNVNDVFDYMLKLRNAGWEEQSREEITKIAHEIKNDYDKTWFEIAELKVKDHYNSASSYI